MSIVGLIVEKKIISASARIMYPKIIVYDNLKSDIWSVFSEPEPSNSIHIAMASNYMCIPLLINITTYLQILYSGWAKTT